MRRRELLRRTTFKNDEFHQCASEIIHTTTVEPSKGSIQAID